MKDLEVEPERFKRPITQSAGVSFNDSETNQPSVTRREYAPYQFTQDSLQMDALLPGVEYTLRQFYRWRDANPAAIERYLDTCQEELANAKSEYRVRSRIGRWVVPHAGEDFRRKRTMREVAVFVVRNLAEIPDPERLDRFSQKILRREKLLKEVIDNPKEIARALEREFSFPADSPERKMLEERLRRLYQILPEEVIQNGVMKEVGRTIFGVGAIAAFDTLDANPDEKRERFAQVSSGAVVYGAAYAIIDGTFQDVRGNFISPKARKLYHETILEGLRTGEPIDSTNLPDHPLTEEVEILYNMIRHYYPIKKYHHLYHAAQSMYIAQDRDARLTMKDTGTRSLTSLYPDLFIKSGMSRVVANILAGRKLDSDFYTRCLNGMLVHQLRDDAVDYPEDSKAQRVTPFTYPREHADTNPLYDIFAYDAYIANEVLHGADSVLADSQGSFFSNYLSSHPERARELVKRYCDNTPKALERFILVASDPSRSTVKQLMPVDKRVRIAVDKATGQRKQVDVDPWTFVLDRVDTINQVIARFVANEKKEEKGDAVQSIMRYALEGGGKRLRPALTLMLAESLGVDPVPLTPFLLSSELFHTASLLLDDLPWQDNSATRRGKPTSHTIYDPASVELTSVSMLMKGIGVIQQLKDQYPAKDIPEVTSYTTHAIEQICSGQIMDLQMTKMKREDITLDAVLEMYHLKTAVAIEASLVPLMMFEKRPRQEIDCIKQFAHHAGLVFQIRDDLFDVSSSAEVVGKDVSADIGKVNVVQLYGSDKAKELMEYHLSQAVGYCKQLPFNTNLLQGIVTYFAKRKH